MKSTVRQFTLPSINHQTAVSAHEKVHAELIVTNYGWLEGNRQVRRGLRVPLWTLAQGLAPSWGPSWGPSRVQLPVPPLQKHPNPVSPVMKPNACKP